MRSSAAIGLAACLVATTSAGPARAGELDRAARALVGGLELTLVPGFHREDDLAIVLDLPGPDVASGRSRLAAALEGLIRAELEAEIAGSVFTLPKGAGGAPGPRAGQDLAAEARAQGAEWLLIVRGDRVGPELLRLFGELRPVDRGLWTPPPAAALVAATASGDVHLDPALARLASLADPGAAGGENPGTAQPGYSRAAGGAGGGVGGGAADGQAPARVTPLAFAGPPARLATVDQAVIALALCAPAPGSPALLFVLSPAVLRAYAREPGATGRLRLAGTLDLAERARATTPARAPLGAVLCAPGRPGRVAFGSTSLANGWLAEVQPRRDGAVTITLERALDGLPLGAGAGDLILGMAAAAHGRFGPRVHFGAGGGAGGGHAEADLGEEFVAATFGPPASGAQLSAYVLTSAGAVLRADGGNPPREITRGGLGLQRITGEHGDVLLTSTPSVEPARDRLSLLALSGETVRPIDQVDLEGPVRATAVDGSSDGGEVIVATGRGGAAAAELWAIRLTTRPAAPP